MKRFMRLTQGSRNAFTLVEVLVVIAIIGVMISMMLPGIQMARESARRLSCSNNLSQLVIAVHQYELAWRHFPPGSTDRGPVLVEAPDAPHFSWLTQILPFLDEGSRYARIDFSQSVYAPTNRLMAERRIAGFTCPSSAGSTFWGGVNYVAVHNDQIGPIAEDNHGAFILNRKLTLDDFPDGLGYTMFLGEKMGHEGGSWMEGTWATMRSPGDPWMLTSYQWKHEISRQNNVVPLPVTGDVPTELDSSNKPSSDASENDESQNDESQNDESQDDESQDDEPESVSELQEIQFPSFPVTQTYGFSSAHSFGGMYAFGDGSVRLLTASMDKKTVRNLANRHDGEVVDGFVRK